MDNGWRLAKPRKKTQAEKNNDRKMNNSFFTKQYEAYGEYFSNFYNPQSIRRDSFRIFKSLADGAIDLEKHIKCFEDTTFVNTLRDIAYEKMTYHSCTQLGLEMFINSYTQQNIPVDGMIYDNYSKHRRSAECYCLLYQAFNNILITHDIIGVLSTLMPILNKYKFSL